MFSDRVYLREEDHRYFHKDNGNEYSSMSSVKKVVKNDFKDSFAYKKASDYTKGLWAQKGKDAAELGTRNHLALETYGNTFMLPPELEDLYPLVKSVFSMYEEYDRILSEQVLYSDKYGIAGTADKICVKKSRKDVKYIDIFDYKNFEKGMEYESKYNQWMKEPLAHLQDCKFNEIILQLSGYALMIQEQFPGIAVRSLNIIVIPPMDPLNWQRIRIPFMKLEVELLFKHFKSLPKFNVQEIKIGI